MAPQTPPMSGGGRIAAPLSPMRQPTFGAGGQLQNALKGQPDTALAPRPTLGGILAASGAFNGSAGDDGDGGGGEETGGGDGGSDGGGNDGGRRLLFGA